MRVEALVRPRCRGQKTLCSWSLLAWIEPRAAYYIWEEGDAIVQPGTSHITFKFQHGRLKMDGQFRYDPKVKLRNIVVLQSGKAVKNVTVNAPLAALLMVDLGSQSHRRLHGWHSGASYKICTCTGGRRAVVACHLQRRVNLARTLVRPSNCEAEHS